MSSSVTTHLFPWDRHKFRILTNPYDLEFLGAADETKDPANGGLGLLGRLHVASEA